MIDICHDAAVRMFQIAQDKEAEPDETIHQMEEAIHVAMFRIKYCRPRCESTVCEQTNGEDP